MTVHCQVILHRGLTPQQLTALGGALWRWGRRAAGKSGTYQFLDSQVLSDLLAGMMPWQSRPEPGGIRLRLRDEVSPDRRSAVAGLRQEIPDAVVEDILVSGSSWNTGG